LIRKYVPAYIIELEKFYQLVVFNYLYSNGDAHLKNFSLLETPNGDYLLSPAYDLINTRIHVKDTDFALDGGLFKDDFESDEVKTNGRVGLHDFQEFGRRLGLREQRMNKLLVPFRTRQELAESLIQKSFMDSVTKEIYRQEYLFRCGQLNKV
jgi:serine/threonine-protein kinase HipA